jgi:L-seryl-tRNA(Ser) seleniumtransferase
MDRTDSRRSLPSVDAVLGWPETRELVDGHGRGPVRAAARAALATHRSDGTPATRESVGERLRAQLRDRPGRVINATGVLLNTNLGRAPLADEARSALLDAAGYCDLEWDTDTGRRGSRHAHLRDLLTELTGAQDGIALNTNAAAVLAALVAICNPGDALVARGQLIEIGGGFRVPEILATSGCRLVEVGTTNKTRIGDYAEAVGETARALLRVHPANFHVQGFTESTPLGQMVALARDRGLAVIDDLGSGLLRPDPGAPSEPDARASVAAGADVVCFSADKLLGGPQAGIVVGTEEAVAAVREHPLTRALRLDKLRVAALSATLGLHLDPNDARRRVPALRMLSDQRAEREERGARLAAQTGLELVSTEARVGGGALPAHVLPSVALVVPGPPEEVAARLRALDPPVAGRIRDGRVLIDVAALTDRDLEELPALLASLSSP